MGHQPNGPKKEHDNATIDQPKMPLVSIFTKSSLGTSSSSPSSSGSTSGVSVSAVTHEQAIRGFSESARIGVDVLSELATIHPFIAVPVLAFKLVINLDLKRRENNAKVLAVKVQIQSMMSVLFRLRNVRDLDEVGPDGLTLPGRLQSLMKEIAKYIEECAAACDLYTKKSLLRKFFKSYIYEPLLADYANRFAEYQTDIERALSIHTTLGIDAANLKLDEQGAKLDDIRSQMKQLFLRLDTPREKEIRETIAAKGGSKACIIDSPTLQSLINKGGEDSSSIAGRREQDLEDMKKKFLDELSEDFNKVLEKNLELFQGKLDIQKREIDEAVTRQGDRIIAFFSGGHERIIDRNIRDIWKEMGWKSTIKSRHLVLALRDHFIRGSNDTYKRHDASKPQQQLLSPPITSPTEHPEYEFSSSQENSDDDWAKAYINLSYLQAISEAIDDDGSGFINITEVNDFTTMRPAGWTLLQWVAYWAAGWQLSISRYSTKIYRLLQKIHRLRQKVRPDNLRILDAHLDKYTLYRLEVLLRSTRTVADEKNISPELAKLCEDFSAQEEERFNENLKKISYNIDSIATVSLITGPGRIERYLYPLLYLLLKHHVMTVQLARSHILHLDELDIAGDSLSNVFLAFDTRLEDLSATFKQMHLDVKSQFENFAFGMFKTSYGTITWSISDYQLASVWEELPPEPTDDEEIAEMPKDIPLTILKYGPQEPFKFEGLTPRSLEILPSEIPTTIQGAWAGYCMWQQDGESVPHKGLFRITFLDSTGENGEVIGKADTYMGSLEMTSVLTPTEDGKTKVDFVMAYVDGYWIRCWGVYDEALAIISGSWYSRDYPSEPRAKPGSEVNDRSDGTFLLARTPADLFRFRYTPAALSENSAKARWSFACSAILYCVKRDNLTRDYVVTRLRDGRRFKELLIKRLTEYSGQTRRSDYTKEERRELSQLESAMCPTVDQFYYSIANFVHRRLTYHFNIFCDSCGRKIVQSRLICIVCLDKTLVNSLDLCLRCKEDNLPSHPAHALSHSLLRGDRVIHDCERTWLIPKAREMSDRLKSAFRVRDLPVTGGDTKEIGVHEETPSSDSMKCIYCQKNVSLPCWVCLECPPDTFVCDECDKEKLLPVLPEKLVTTPPSMVHVMLRITDDKQVEIPDDDQLARIEKRLAGVKHNVEERLENLEKELTTRTKSLEDLLKDHVRGIDGTGGVDTSSVTIEHKLAEHLEGLDKKLEDRISVLETRFTSLEQLIFKFFGEGHSSQ